MEIHRTPRQPDGAMASTCRVIGTLRAISPLFYEHGIAHATIVVNRYTVYLRGRDAVASQGLAIGAPVEITGSMRRVGRRIMMTEIIGELVADTTLRPR